MCSPPRWSMFAMIAILFAELFAFAGSPADAAEFAVVDEENWKAWIPAGKETDTIYGDVVMRNAHVIAVIAQPKPWRNANMTVRKVGGSLIDFTVRDRPNDQLSAFYPGASAFELQAVDGGLKQVDGSVSYELRAPAKPGQPQVSVTYSLADEPWLTITSVYTNPHDEPIEFTPKDSLRADRSFEFRLGDRGLLFEDDWWHQAYFIELNDHRMEAQGDTLERGRPVFKLVPRESASQPLKPGESTTIERRLFVGDNGLHLRSAMGTAGTDAETTGATVKAGQVNLRVRDTFGPVANARLTIESVDGDVIGHGRTNELGEVRTTLAAGDYRARLNSHARPSHSETVTVTPAPEQTVTIAVEAPGFVRGNITDEQGRRIPCKVEFKGSKGTPNPDFGPDTYAETVKNLVYSHNGQFRQELRPGTYDVIVSRGPEYDAIFTSVEVQQGIDTPLNGKLKRSVATPGWISSDFHSHSTPSGDNTSWQRGRVLNLVCEQIEFGPCTEHNRISTYVDHLEFYGLSDVMQTCSGMELTGSPLPVNHQNAFPLRRTPRTQDGGGPVTDENPVVQIERLALWDQRADKVVQGNHPNLMQVLGDRNLDQKADGGFERMLGWMDVVEVHPPAKILDFPTAPAQPRERTNVIFHWLQLLNQGYRIPGVVNTDSHYNYHGSGWLRNYLKSSTDEPGEIIVAEMVKSAERGNVIMTNGPYLQVDATSVVNGIQRVATAGDDLVSEGTIRLSIKVQCANWLDVNRVQLFLNGRPQPDYNYRRATHNDAFQTNTVRFEKTVTLELSSDTHIIVATVGEGLKLGPVVGPSHQDDVPIAVSNPIFVDVDGDGFEPNGDTLGLPLPVPK